ncbi:hypothetical protein D2V07_07155 [Aurantiacibacter zhengii]|uniref:Phytase-like domain-containing protein n=2 Tax=Aurantiacibacter zhengii TaxID=2307003 RepID=A0A418NSC1_9SPHN|nr:hypothetical protein D2V07_07155 [Aurantiacibacter zhengii]
MLSPGVFFRTPIPDYDAIELSITPLTGIDLPGQASGFVRIGVWELDSRRADFGGFSAILVTDDGAVRAFSDRGKHLTFTAPGHTATRAPLYQTIDRGGLSNRKPDIESATGDPATGDYWLGIEQFHSLIRFSADGEYEAARAPSEWQGWDMNAGAEAMARLPDGRFLVLPEGRRTGLLYPSDPVGKIAPTRFTFAVPGGYSSTDMAALPDGRVLILLRQIAWGIPPFESALAIADPATIADGGSLDIDLLIDLDTIVPSENYEGLALAGDAGDGAVHLWLIADDNLASFQRTLLVHLAWREDAVALPPGSTHEKARGEP